MGLIPGLLLDRDGVINEIVMRGDVVGSPRTIEEFKLQSGIESIVRYAKSCVIPVVVVTNQPDLERGLLAQEALDEMHRVVAETLPVDAVLVCASSNDADPRRKPNPGMLLEALERFNLDPKRTLIVGDTARDVVAGKRAGVHTMLIETSYNSAAHGSADINVKTFQEALSSLRSFYGFYN